MDCEYQNWTAWTSCSVTCGGGRKSRRKLIKTPASNGGRQCDQRLDSNFDEVQCNTQICPAGIKFHVADHFANVSAIYRFNHCIVKRLKVT